METWYAQRDGLCPEGLRRPTPPAAPLPWTPPPRTPWSPDHARHPTFRKTRSRKTGKEVVGLIRLDAGAAGFCGVPALEGRGINDVHQSRPIIIPRPPGVRARVHEPPSPRADRHYSRAAACRRLSPAAVSGNDNWNVFNKAAHGHPNDNGSGRTLQIGSHHGIWCTACAPGPQATMQTPVGSPNLLKSRLAPICPRYA